MAAQTNGYTKNATCMQVTSIQCANDEIKLGSPSGNKSRSSASEQCLTMKSLKPVRKNGTRFFSELVPAALFAIEQEKSNLQ